MNCSRRSSRTSEGPLIPRGLDAGRLLKFTVLSVVIGLLGAPAMQAKEFRFDYQKVYQTGPDVKLDLTYVSGNLEIVSSGSDQIVIDAIKKVNAVSMDEAEEVADHIEIKARQDKNRVVVTTNYLRMRNRNSSFWQKVLGIGGSDSFGEVDWAIQVPVGCEITIHSTSGGMRIDHVRGDLNIRSSSADIELQSIEGRVYIENSSGSTTGELLFGPVTVRQPQGKIDLRFVEGDIRIKSSSADIKIRQDRGSIDLTTSSGNVDIQTNLDSSRDYFVETESGNITLTIPETSSGDLRIESQTGDIKTDIPIAIKSMSRKQVQGTFGFGGVTVTLNSISGDVIVARF